MGSVRIAIAISQATGRTGRAGMEPGEGATIGLAENPAIDVAQHAGMPCIAVHEFTILAVEMQHDKPAVHVIMIAMRLLHHAETIGDYAVSAAGRRSRGRAGSRQNWTRRDGDKSLVRLPGYRRGGRNW